MKTLKELRQARADKAVRGKAALAEVNTLGAVAERTAEQEARFTAANAELDALETEVTELDAQISAQEAGQRRAVLFAAPSRAALGAARTVREGNPETTFGFKSMSEFAVAVRAAQVGLGSDPRLAGVANDASAPATFNQNQGAAGEGFLVPPDYSRQVWDIAFEQTDLLGMANPEPLQGNTVIKPKDETTPWGAAGVQATWAAESAQLTPSKLALTGELMQLHKLYAFCAATDEVLADAGMIQNRLTIQAGRAIRWKGSESVMTGTGVGMPLGFMNAPSLITIPKDNGQGAKTLTVNNLLTMAARVLRTGGRPMWMANADVLPQLGQLVIGNMPAWLPMNQALYDGPFEGHLLGWPLLFSEHGSTLGTAGDIVAMNLDGYYAATKAGGGIDFASSIHLYFDQGMTAFRWTFRVAGMPFLSQPVQPAKGANTKSHFIALATRA